MSARLPVNPLILSPQHEKSMAVYTPAAAGERCTWDCPAGQASCENGKVCVEGLLLQVR